MTCAVAVVSVESAVVAVVPPDGAVIPGQPDRGLTEGARLAGQGPLRVRLACVAALCVHLRVALVALPVWPPDLTVDVRGPQLPPGHGGVHGAGRAPDACVLWTGYRVARPRHGARPQLVIVRPTSVTAAITTGSLFTLQ